jgi:hypothetical protein
MREICTSGSTRGEGRCIVSSSTLLSSVIQSPFLGSMMFLVVLCRSPALLARLAVRLHGARLRIVG